MSLRTRIGIGAALAAILGIITAAFAVYFAVDNYVRDDLDGQLAERVRLLQNLRPGTPSAQQLQAVPDAPPGRPPGFIQIVRPDGSIVRLGVSALPVDDATRRIASGASGQAYSETVVGGEPVRMLAAPVRGVGAVLVALPLADANALLVRLRWTLILSALGAALFSALVGWWITGVGLGPLRRLNTAARDVARTGDLSTRIRPEGRDEVAQLGTSFDAMLTALEASRDAQRNLVLDASHELRTPLTALRTTLEVAQDPSVTPTESRDLIRRAVSRAEELTNLVADVTALARGEESPGVQLPVDLGDLVAGVAERFRALHPEARIDLRAESCLVMGVATDLERAVGNLIGNALKFGPQEGPVDVAVSDGVVRVRDHGPGVPADERSRIFERFHRGRDVAGIQGSGLGLAIVDQVTSRHGGSVDVEDDPGGGAIFVLRLPLLSG